MVVEEDTFWWEDTSCLTRLVDNKTAAPICQHSKVSGCPGGQFDGHCYVLMDTFLSWQDAEQLCVDLGGHLASIHSVPEYDFVNNLVKSNSSQTLFWLGASDETMEVGPQKIPAGLYQLK